eukprot:1144315-Pelagomonas_calceolata.AAC.2
MSVLEMGSVCVLVGVSGAPRAAAAVAPAAVAPAACVGAGKVGACATGLVAAKVVPSVEGGSALWANVSPP